MNRKKKFIFSITLGCIALLAGFHVFQIHSLTALAYHVAQTEENLAQLKHENTNLQAETYQAASPEDLVLLATQRGFQKVTSITYIRQVAGPVAQNQP